jgi:hypothetical protein
MDNPPLSVKVVPFQEHFTIDISQNQPHIFDITSEGFNFPPSFMSKGHFLMDAYCQALINKIKMLDSLDVPDFIGYQCALLKSPIKWLDELEKLIEVNYDLFEDHCHKAILHKLYVNIQLCRQNLKSRPKPLKEQLINWDNVLEPESPLKFDFNAVKLDLARLNSFNEKMAYLIEVKANYLQYENSMNLLTSKNFIDLVNIELDKMGNLRSILSNPDRTPKSSKSTKSTEEVVDLDNGSVILRINGNINILVDLFYQMLHEIKTDGKPFIDNSPSEVAQFITLHFTDRNRKKMSINTVKTMLSPNKADKRPSSSKKLNIKDLMNPSMILCHMYIIDYLNIIDIFPMLN